MKRATGMRNDYGVHVLHYPGTSPLGSSPTNDIDGITTARDAIIPRGLQRACQAGEARERTGILRRRHMFAGGTAFQACSGVGAVRAKDGKEGWKGGKDEGKEARQKGSKSAPHPLQRESRVCTKRPHPTARS